jgi:hypothetical protein
MAETNEERYARLQGELATYVDAEQTSFDEVRQLLHNVENQFLTLTVYEIPIKIRPTIPKPLRRVMEKMQNQGDSLEPLEMSTYEVLAGMCKESPWNVPKTWELIDTEDGIAFEVLEMMYTLVGNKEKQTANFRKGA